MEKQKQKIIISQAEEIKRLNSELKNLSRLVYIDDLTGAGNTRMKNMILTKEIEKSLRMNNTISIINADINFLKRTNDIKGHSYGDHLIKTAAKIMKESVREYDTVCRTGGDEFIIILPDADIKTAKSISKRIIDGCLLAGISISTGASCIEEFKHKETDPKKIIEKMQYEADQRMYKFKKEVKKKQSHILLIKNK
jgi:diguanylate cyclase (GGDEF)-like protein